MPNNLTKGLCFSTITIVGTFLILKNFNNKSLKTFYCFGERRPFLFGKFMTQDCILVFYSFQNLTKKAYDLVAKDGWNRVDNLTYVKALDHGQPAAIKLVLLSDLTTAITGLDVDEVHFGDCRPTQDETTLAKSRTAIRNGSIGSMGKEIFSWVRKQNDEASEID